MLQLGGRVGGAGGGDDAIETVDGVREGDVVNLRRRLATSGSPKKKGRGVGFRSGCSTVLRENRQMTLSHSVPSLRSKARRLPMALAR